MLLQGQQWPQSNAPKQLENEWVAGSKDQVAETVSKVSNGSI